MSAIPANLVLQATLLSIYCDDLYGSVPRCPDDQTSVIGGSSKTRFWSCAKMILRYRALSNNATYCTLEADVKHNFDRFRADGEFDSFAWRRLRMRVKASLPDRRASGEYLRSCVVDYGLCWSARMMKWRPLHARTFGSYWPRSHP